MPVPDTTNSRIPIFSRIVPNGDYLTFFFSTSRGLLLREDDVMALVSRSNKLVVEFDRIITFAPGTFLHLYCREPVKKEKDDDGDVFSSVAGSPSSLEPELELFPTMFPEKWLASQCCTKGCGFTSPTTRRERATGDGDGSTMCGVPSSSRARTAISHFLTCQERKSHFQGGYDPLADLSSLWLTWATRPKLSKDTTGSHLNISLASKSR